MTWFKVDDGLHSHKKAVRAGIPAMGLWVMAGSWCADQLTNGWVPDYIAMRLDRDYEQNAKVLVQVGLWVEDVRDGETGWQFHEWNEPGRQPTKDQVLADRAASADRQKRARDRAKEHRERELQGESPNRHAVTDGVTHADVTGAVTAPPTRPDPTRPKAPTELGNAAGAAAQDAFAGMPERPPVPTQANDVIKAFVDACREDGQDDPTTVTVKRIGKDAKRLLEAEKVPGHKVLAAAEFIAKEGWQSLDSGLRRLAADRDKQPRSSTRAGTPSNFLADSRAPGRDYSERL